VEIATVSGKFIQLAGLRQRFKMTSPASAPMNDRKSALICRRQWTIRQPGSGIKYSASRDNKIMDSREIVQVEDDTDSAGCDGGGGALGHPLVYLTFDDGDVVDCYYCSRRFAKARALKPKNTTEGP
jgi:uncharacterized Zn-finger protein